MKKTIETAIDVFKTFGVSLPSLYGYDYEMVETMKHLVLIRNWMTNIEAAYERRIKS